MKPFLLEAPCKDYLWGGNRLREFGKHSDADRIAESWELSCHPEGESVIASGAFAGMTLTAFLREHPEALGRNGRRFDRFPVLVKLIDAHDDLSVQVHPDDAYALSHEGEYGKTEMWYILDAQPGAQLIYGFAREVTREEFRRAIEENTLLDIVRRVPVKAGDVFFIPAGTLHAIGKGILIAEIQQNSNTTYRVYDYGRIGKDGKPRDLHIDKALAVTNLTPMPDIAHHAADKNPAMLGRCEYFTASRLVIEPGERREITDGAGSSFVHLVCIRGSGTLMTEEEHLPLQPGSSVFIPADCRSRAEGDCTLLCTAVEPEVRT